MNFVGVSAYDWLHTTKYCNDAATLLCTSSNWNLFHPKLYIGPLELWKPAGKLETQPLKKLNKQEKKKISSHNIPIFLVK